MAYVNGSDNLGRAAFVWPVAAAVLCSLLLLFTGEGRAKEPASSVGSPTAGLEIRRTSGGIPHVRADNWRDLGIGVGYVQAQDALCTLAEAFVTYEGRRAWFFGAEARPARDSTFGRPKNVDLDFFFRAFADESVLVAYRAQSAAGLQELVDGFAAGYNRFLGEARQGRVPAAGRACLNAPWVRNITADDVHRRLYAAQIAAGYAKFVTEIANARPMTLGAPHAEADRSALRRRLAQRIGTQPGIGSNVLAFGGQATGGDGAVLFGNPHWYWGGPDRFYQMHLTIPGQVDVAGVAFLGVPVVMIGFNEQVAWSHTVSVARRFGLFDLTLDPARPTRYRVDDAVEAMTTREVSVDVRGPDGRARPLTRTFYSTRFGPVVDLGGHNPAFGWSAGHAVVMRDVNAENFRVFNNFFHWNQAKSLDDFVAIQRREAAVPWVNTVAIGRGDGRVWYGDVGAVPNAPDDLREACVTPLAKGFETVDALTPVLDGSRSACDWRRDPAAVQDGALPVAALPWLLREDYVANMNDSYWLSNVHQPLEGFPSLVGGERQALGLRGRLGHRIALDLVDAHAPSAEALGRLVMKEVLTPRAYSAELFKDDLLALACDPTPVLLDAETLKAAGLGGQGKGARQVDVAPACAILRQWSNRAEVGDRGALLWEDFWARLAQVPAEEFYGVPFSSDIPLLTPRQLRLDRRTAANALAMAVVESGSKGWRLNEVLGSRRFVETGGRRVPVYGGCDMAGYFTVACNADGSGKLGPDSLANSYLQVVRFDTSGVDAHTLLAHGQDEAALSGKRRDALVEGYAGKRWQRFPFREDDIVRDPEFSRHVLVP